MIIRYAVTPCIRVQGIYAHMANLLEGQDDFLSFLMWQHNPRIMPKLVQDRFEERYPHLSDR